MKLPLVALSEPLFLGLATKDALSPIRNFTHETPPVQFQIDEHIETISFLIIPGLFNPVFLPHDWLLRHNHVIDWQLRLLQFNS